MSPALKQCPHCGGIAEIDTLWTYRAISDGQMGRGVSIYCLSCDAQMMRCYADHPGEEREDVCAALVEAWNTRALEREAKAEPVAWAYVNTDGECEQIEWGAVPNNLKYDPSITRLYAALAVAEKREEP